MQCPCCSGATYDDCCGPSHRGEAPAATALALMRSRYCAFALGEIDYLLMTSHPATRSQHDRQALADWSAAATWLGLTINRVVAGAPGMAGGVVDFTAHFAEGGAAQHLREVSWFTPLDGRWYYVDGSGDERLAARKAPCICGSGKPLKRCCLR